MPLQDLLQTRIKGVVPYNKLVIDAGVWRDAHEQHHAHRRLHYTSSHRPGIVYGLDVFLLPGDKSTLVVSPGVAIDSDGNVLLNTNYEKFALNQAGEMYLVINYEDNDDAEHLIELDGVPRSSRVIEGRRLVVIKHLPDEPYVELARIERSSDKASIKSAPNPFDPGVDELNLLHRTLAFPYCAADGSVGELCFVPKTNPDSWKQNRAGLWNMLREGNSHGMHLGFAGLYVADEHRDDRPLMLYVAGSEEFRPLSSQQTGELTSYLAGGGLIFGEACGGDKGFAEQFQEVAKSLGASLKKVDRNHQLLRSNYTFPVPPNGASAGEVLADLDMGVVFSTMDYGKAWQGDIKGADAVTGRDRVRQSIEFGLNVVAAAQTRSRQCELKRIAKVK